MAFDPLTVAETNADSPITEPLMAKIKDNFDDLDTRVNNTPPIGAMAMWPYSAVPARWLACDGTEASCTTFEALFDVALPDILAWGRGTPIGNFTVDTVTDEIILVAHGQAVGNVVYLANTAGGLPAGLVADTKYYVVALNGADRFKVSATKGGVAIDITTAGTGTHSAFDTFKLPDTRGRSPLGVNDAGLPNGADGGLTTRNEGDRGGEEAHQLTTAELAAHTHVVPAKDNPSTGTSTISTGSAGTAANKNTQSTGSGTAHNTMHPFFTVNFIIYAGV